MYLKSSLVLLILGCVDGFVQNASPVSRSSFALFVSPQVKNWRSSQPSSANSGAYSAPRNSLSDLYGSAPPKAGSAISFKNKKSTASSPANVSTLYGPPPTVVQETPVLEAAPSAPEIPESTPKLIEAIPAFSPPSGKLVNGYKSERPTGLCTPPTSLRLSIKTKRHGNVPIQGFVSPPANGMAGTTIRRFQSPASMEAAAAPPADGISDLYRSGPPTFGSSMPKRFAKKEFKNVGTSSTNGLYGPPSP
eukprot:CAMPEP_0202457994 /NCGR_PEP_ID=MMETSP1360-20130828/19131_1 /ASSEMBLY_ACC=CAM_ASM_000848 /TAXON_ID=515479 /ORGANISM="Licmophora paradoxa, Strain CCMP2313" /LENGTH=248 /DNA_ID=CAMNT_0049078283 /DNA_START=29 /DNA_END=775 /DNA_ORIENTATION=+